MIASIITLSCAQVAFADAKSQLEKVNSKEAAKLVAKVYEEGMTLEETVRKALKQAF